jgi:hypothetical protein
LETAFGDDVLQQLVHLAAKEIGAAFLRVYVHYGYSHLAVVLCQCINECMLPRPVGFSYASLEQVSVNGMTETSFGNVYKNGGCGFLLFGQLLYEYCTQRKGDNRGSLCIQPVYDTFALEMFFQWKCVLVHIHLVEMSKNVIFLFISL